ncbi:helix-turn-helix domain-containing protein [bacterium]|nr:helix-turn-helix domain-containing protein [bacterium]
MDSNYLQEYTKGLLYFQNDLDLVVSTLEKRKCVVLCSAYKMGDRRFVDYLNFTIEHDDRFDVYYDKENTYTQELLELIQQRVTSRIKVLLLPWYFRMSDAFKELFTSLMKDRKNTFISVIILEPEFFERPERVFATTNIPMEVILTRKPLDKDAAGQLLETRCGLEKVTLTDQQKEKIISLSGGHIGLLKRVFNLAIQGKTLTPTEVLSDPAIKADLLNLELQYRTLSQATCKKIGLLRDDNSVAVPLLRYFLNSIQQNLSDTLSPLYQKLLTLFLEKEGEIVTKEEIHALMNEEQEYSLWAVYKNISRFAKAIQKKYAIKNVSGKGYMLLDKEKDGRVF